MAEIKQWFGHPRGLSTLFFTEMWERFSYYGMRALLILFMTASVTHPSNPGLGFGVERSAAIYGLYTGLVFLLSLPGGWVADKLWGQRKAVFVGGCFIALGHFTLALPMFGFGEHLFFFLGLFFIVIGTGLLKPNVSTLVGALYPSAEEHENATPEQADAARLAGARRDAGFSIFYMGINTGALLGPTICGFLGEKVNWHWGFSAAGFGMLIGVIQYRYGVRHLAGAGEPAAGEDPQTLRRRARNFYLAAALAVVAVGTVAWLGASGAITVNLTAVAGGLIYAILAVVALYFVYLFFFAGYGVKVKRRLVVIIWLFLLAAVFWSGFEQAGSSMNIFARDLTDRMIGSWLMPTSWLQNVNPLFIILLAPVFGWLWTALARSRRNPSIPFKFALGLLGLAAGFFVLSWGAANAAVHGPVSPSWLVVTYFLHTCGELCLSPVGLSSFTKLAPADRVGQMMGIWFVASGLGNVYAGLVAGRLENLAPQQLFWSVAMFAGVAGLLALLVSPVVRRIMGHVD